jgi:hypothetical protein
MRSRHSDDNFDIRPSLSFQLVLSALALNTCRSSWSIRRMLVAHQHSISIETICRVPKLSTTPPTLPHTPRSLARMPPSSLLRLCTHIPTSAASPLRPLACRARTRFAPRSNSHLQLGLRTMASSTAPLQEWLIIAPDFEGALEKRLAVRGEHLGGLKADPEDFWLWGGTFGFPPSSKFFCRMLPRGSLSRLGWMLTVGQAQC